MKRQNVSIVVLTLTAVVLAAAHVLVQPQRSEANTVIKDRDYQVVTAKVVSGGDGLYILDNRTGQIAVFTYDPASRGVRARSVRDVSDAFAPGR